MIYSNMLQEIESHVSQLFKKNTNEKLVYHTLSQTREVIQRAAEISAHSNLPDGDRFVLLAAAWFQNTGRLFDNTDMFVQRSVENMQSFFALKDVNEPETIGRIEKLLRYTTNEREPENGLEEILHDANTYYVGTENFKKCSKSLRKEERLKGSNKDLNWRQKTLAWLKQHNFYTQYCRNLLEKTKLENIGELMQKGDVADAPTILEEDKKLQAAQVKGIQTMMRVMNDNHIEFSSIADNKANLLISVNAIMISVVLSILVRRLEVDTHLTIPTLLFLLVAVVTIVLSILSTKPKVSSGVFSRDDVLNRKINLMYFGNYHKTKMEDYEWGMKKLLNDPDYLYSTMIRDVHQLGVVLSKKYRLIGAAYTVFMYGIILTVLAFIIAIAFGQPASNAPTPL